MKVVASFSGGLDSTVLLYSLRAADHDVTALSVFYGQRHARELDAARTIAAGMGIAHHVLDLSALRPLLRGSSQTDDAVAVPRGHYAEETMKATVVPNRNMILLAVAIALAISSGADAVAYAAHAGDHTIYPDCREEFVEAMQLAAQLCDWRPINILRPFVHLTKAALVTLGTSLAVPFHETWSCYDGDVLHCGQCGTCVERREAFTLAGVPDPTIYA